MQLKRIRDASGQARNFGFADYGDAESVLRCLEVINGVPLPSNSGPEKTLSVRPHFVILSAEYSCLDA